MGQTICQHPICLKSQFSAHQLPRDFPGAMNNAMQAHDSQNQEQLKWEDPGLE